MRSGLKADRNPQLIHALNHHTDVVTEHLAQQFIDERGIRLGTQRIANLRLHHGEGGLRASTLPA